MEYYQPTSAPYNPDNLKPHDTDLVWTMEFGTETTENIGQSFVTSDSSGTPDTQVNARTGMLEVRQNGSDPDSMAGVSFLIPPWETYAPSPLVGPDTKVMMLFAHFMLADSNIDDPSGATALLVLSGEDFVGNVDGMKCSTIGIVGDELMGGIGLEASLLLQLYANGAGQEPTDEAKFERWGTNLYVRLMIITDVSDEQKESEMIVWVGRDGISWTLIGETQIAANAQFRRIGLGFAGAPGMAALDWMRIYNYPLAGITQDGGVLTPVFPVTGDRRF